MLTRVLMQAVQLCVKCLPKRFRLYLREQPRLAYLYTAWLCRTRLHPSVNHKIAIGNTRHQTVEKHNPLYSACMAHHISLLQNATATQATKRQVNACAIVFNQQRFHVFEDELTAVEMLQAQNLELTRLEQSINSIEACVEAPEHIWVLCDSKSTVKLANQMCKSRKNITVCDAPKISRMSQTLPSNIFVVGHGDIVHEYCFAALNRSSCEAALSYVDTDKLEDGDRFDPAFYPDWNPDLLLSTEYIKTGLLLTKAPEQLTRLAEHNWQFSKMLIAMYLQDAFIEVGHIPFVLVHQQNIETDVPAPLDSSIYFKSKQNPLVSLIIPTYNGVDILRPCVESILEKTTYTNYEICIVNNRSDDEATLAFLADIQAHEKVSVLDYPYPFNYSAINNYAAEHTRGEVIGLINNDVEVIAPDWLSLMVTHVLRADVGCVGAKLLYSNELVQHAGVVMGYGGGAGHANKYLPNGRPGYMQRAIATQNYSAVTAACLLVKREDFENAGKLNETDLTVAFNDVDFCLNVLALGKRNVWVAEALLYHHESISRGHEDTLEKQKRFQAEVKYMQTKWAKYIQHDPAYNPNLTLTYENFSIRENLEKIDL